MDTLTNSAPTVAYLSRDEIFFERNQRHQCQQDEIERHCLGVRGHGRDTSEPAYEEACEFHDWLASRDHHHHEYEQRLGEVAAFKVFDGGRFAGEREFERDKYQRPETEHRLDFAQEVKGSGVRWVAMREAFEVGDGEGVDDGKREERCADHLDGGGVHTMKSTWADGGVQRESVGVANALRVNQLAAFNAVGTQPVIASITKNPTT
jgi:hypothetical protein